MFNFVFYKQQGEQMNNWFWHASLNSNIRSFQYFEIKKTGFLVKIS